MQRFHVKLAVNSQTQTATDVEAVDMEQAIKLARAQYDCGEEYRLIAVEAYPPVAPFQR